MSLSLSSGVVGDWRIAWGYKSPGWLAVSESYSHHEPIPNRNGPSVPTVLPGRPPLKVRTVALAQRVSTAQHTARPSAARHAAGPLTAAALRRTRRGAEFLRLWALVPQCQGRAHPPLGQSCGPTCLRGLPNPTLLHAQAPRAPEVGGGVLVTGAVLVGAGVDVEVAGTVVEGAGEEVAAAARKQHARSAPVPGRWPGGMRAQQMDRMTAWTTSVRWQPQGLTKMRLMHHQEHQKGHQVIEEPQHSHCDLKEGGRHTCDWSRGGRGGRACPRTCTGRHLASTTGPRPAGMQQGTGTQWRSRLDCQGDARVAQPYHAGQVAEVASTRLCSLRPTPSGTLRPGVPTADENALYAV